ncbi:MAG: HEAT repeat domain-containing protein [Actinomycetota bacterium]
MPWPPDEHEGPEGEESAESAASAASATEATSGAAGTTPASTTPEVDDSPGSGSAARPVTGAVREEEIVGVVAVVEVVRRSRELPADERLVALSQLDGVTHPEAFEVALAALTHDLSSGVRERAIRVLADAPAATRLEALDIASGDPQPAVRAAGLNRLVGDDIGAARHVLRALEDPDDAVADMAGEVLVRRIRSDPATVWAALKRSSGARRERLKVVLAGERPDELEQLRAEHARSDDPEDRVLAAELVPTRDIDLATQAGLALLRDPSANVRAAAVRALARVPTAPVIEGLRAAITDPSPAVRLEAVRTLVQQDDPAGVDRLLGRLGDPDIRVRATVIEGLERRASRALAHRLIAALEDERLRTGATELLVSMDRFAEPLLLDALADRGGAVREAIGEALDQVVGVDELSRRLTSVDRDERETAVEALAAIGTPAALGQLLRSLDDPDEEIRMRAVRRLGTTDDPRAIAGLRSTAERDPVREIAEAAKEGLRAQDVVVDLD